MADDVPIIFDGEISRPMTAAEYKQWQTDQAARPDQALAALRALRDRLLTGCDWTQMADSPLDDTTKTAWAKYRQQLRDWPDQKNLDPLNPPAWPAPPA